MYYHTPFHEVKWRCSGPVETIPLDHVSLLLIRDVIERAFGALFSDTTGLLSFVEKNRLVQKVKWGTQKQQCVLKCFLLFQYISNKIQRYTVYFTWKLLYMFRVVTTPIIKSANNCIYSIWYLSPRNCYLLLSWKSWNWFECVVGGVHHPQHTQTSSNSSTIAAGNSNGVTNARCCKYSCLRSWWLVLLPPETCRAVFR
jgi:hypothetical protein